MPAIYPARLKIQVGELARQFENSRVFVHDLHGLLNYYSNRTYRPGQSGEPPPLIAQYNVPPPVLRQVIKDLKPLLTQNQQAAIELVDALWEEPFLELKQLAAKLLGQLEPNPPEMIFDRIENWGTSKIDDQLQRMLIIEGSTRLRQEKPQEYLGQAETWLAEENNVLQQVGLRAVLALLTQNHFDNLPALYRALTPKIWSASSQLRFDIVEIIGLLAKRSPRETAAFLKQNLIHKAEFPTILWIIRKSIPFFPPEIQASLRNTMRVEE